MTRRFVLVGTLVAACSQQQIPTPERSLNRPTDVAVGCVQGAPPSPNQPGSRLAAPPVLCNQNTTTTLQIRSLAFIPNSATGEVAVAALAEGDAGYAQLVDLDSRQPGYNFIPVGRLPIAAQTTSDGCRVMVVNEGSCDLSSIDVAKVANGADTKTEQADTAFTVAPHTSAGPILAKPRAIQIIPRTDIGTRDVQACTPDYPYHAFVSFPSCDLVAEIDLSTGAYVRGVFLHADGTTTDAGAAPNCPVECSDLGTGTGNPPPAEVRPVALALDATDPNPPCDDPEFPGMYGCKAPNCYCPATTEMNGTPHPWELNSLYVGGSTSRYVYKVDLTMGKTLAAANANSLQLDTCEQAPTPTSATVKTCDPLGVLRVRLSPAPGAANPQTFVGPFVYAVALDGTIRVISVDEFRECETAADAQLVAQRFPMLTSLFDPYSGVMAGGGNPACLPLDETRGPTDIAIRRVMAVGPGIRPSGAALDIAFASGFANTSTTEALGGTFGFVVGSNGTLTVVNVDSQVYDPQEPAAKIPHVLHNRNSEVPGAGATNGDPTTGAPNVDPGTIRYSLPVNVGIDQTNAYVPTLPSISGYCPSTPSSGFGPAIHYPDPVGPHYENWTVIYEQGLPDLLRSGGKLGADTPTTMTLLDPGGRFCARGAMPGDFIEFAGCTDNTQCPKSEACFGAFGGQPGLCLAAETTSNGTQVAPGPWLDLVNSRHEFRVIATANQALTLDEKPLSIPRAGGCQSDADCTNIDLYGAPGATPTHLFNKSMFVCDPSPWPGSNARQCVLACRPPVNSNDGLDNWSPHDDDCQADPSFGANSATSGLYVEYTGYVCGHEPIDPTKPSGPRRCVASRVPRSPTYDQDPRVGINTADACFILPVAYQVHAGMGFLLQGDRTGYIHNLIAADDGSCVMNPAGSVKRVGRLSYNAPMCTFPQQADVEDRTHPYQAGEDTGVRDSSGNPICVWNGKKQLPTPNPCLRTACSTQGNVCTPILVWEVENHEFEAAIGPVALINVDGANKITSIGPPVFGNNYGFSFQITGGFLPLIGITNAALPSTIHGGPMFPGPPNRSSEWLYVIDSGDQISPTLGTLLQGQMVRIDALSLGIDTKTTVQ